MSRRQHSVCPIAKSLDIFGDKWTLLIIRDLFAGKSTYNEFLKSPEGIATNILADRLRRLQEGGLIAVSDHPDSQRKKSYSLTERGISLFPVIGSIADWGLSNVKGTEKRIKVKKPKRRG